MAAAAAAAASQHAPAASPVAESGGGAAAGRADAGLSPGAVPIDEMTVEEMMVMNLQRQIRSALAHDDVERAAGLNDQLAALEATLGIA